jgi:tocopherol cyclase
MHRFNYENPDGQKRHNQLWNGGWAAGRVELYAKANGEEQLVDIFDGEMGGCEYGEATPV